MKHARSDYDKRIVDLENKIPEDEPVFLLRGQDSLAPKLLMMWATDLLLRDGDPSMAESAMQQAQRMLKWQKEHGTKTPDMYVDINKRQAKEVLLRMIECVKADPKYYFDRTASRKFSEALVNYFDTNKPPVLMITRFDLIEASRNKPIAEITEKDIDFINKVEFGNYKLIMIQQPDGVYILENKIQ